MSTIIGNINHSLRFPFGIRFFANLTLPLTKFNSSPLGSTQFARQALKSHIHNAYRSTNGRYYMFVVILSKKVNEKDLISLSNDDAHLALPTHQITYKQ